MSVFGGRFRIKALKNKDFFARNGSPGRIRTYDQSINSRLLYR